LRLYRQRKAGEISQNKNKIFNNQMLERLLEKKPATFAELRSIRGVGPMTIRNYGKDILDIFKQPDEDELLDISTITDVPLSPEQEKVLQEAYRGNSVLMTGPGGVGKSFLIKNIVKIAETRGCSVQVCGMTGTASELLDDAMTLHSWSGARLMNQSIQDTIELVRKNRKALGRWRGVDVLVIDEISMLSKPSFEILDALGKNLRESREEFGGIQVIGSGDFLQIPPVADSRIPDSHRFAFESPRWSELFPKERVIELTRVFRQTDPVFQKILRQIRRGGISPKMLKILQTRLHQPCDPKHTPTIITPKRGSCQQINNESLSRLEGEAKVFEMTVNNGIRTFVPENVVSAETRSLKKCAMNEVIRLKIGSQVMCVVNVDMKSEKQIVNGSRGIVRGWQNGYPLVEFQNGRVSLMIPHKIASDTIEGLSISQVPLISAWAITTHKSQGVTLESAAIDAGSENFEYGQVYVALSRVKTLEGVYLTSLDPTKIGANPKVLEYYRSLK
jgi:ATP-dependent DNA helicase PIF1